MTTLGLIHVMRADQNRHAFGRKIVDVLPEVAACVWIDPGRRFVEQRQLRRMQQACGERKALLPSTRQRACELRAPRSEAQSLERGLDGLSAIVNGVHASDKVQVFFDRQIFVQAEALRHVTDLALDLRCFGPDVVAEARALARVGRQQPAEHSNRRRLAAAVRSQKAENLAALDTDREVLDNGASLVALGEAVNVDGGFAHCTVTSTGSPGCSAGFGSSGRASTRNTSFDRFSRL